jgi:asparagine N-glycosylation enzyme membrane subunit Stt3
MHHLCLIMDEAEKRKELVKKVKGFFKEDEKEIDLTEQRDELIKFLKTGKAYYVLLIPILLLTYFIRTRNLSMLSGKYLLGLDPYAFFRYSQEIIETGTMLTHDMMRYVPIGYNLRIDYIFLSNFMAYTYKIINIFIPSMTQIEWHIIYPPVATVISLVFLFLFVREIFDSKVAILSATFLGVVPAYIYRTGAGFADHEALAMLFMFIALYLFALMWKSEKINKSILFGASSGLFSTAMYFTWSGGYRFLIISLAGLAIVGTLLTKISTEQFAGYLSWFGSFILFSAIGLGKISFIKELENLALLFSVIVLISIKLKPIRNIAKQINDLLPYKIPIELIIIGGVGIVSFLVGWALGIVDPSFIIGRILHPGGTSRFAFTVSENQQPYVIGGNGWWSGFGWTFLLAFVGSVYLIINMFKSLKVGLAVASSYLVFFLIFIFGRFSPDAKYAKIAAFSSATYLFWFAGFIFVFLGLYIYYYNKKKSEFKEIFNVDWGLILVFIWFLFTAIIARGAVRTIFAFAPAVSIVGAYFVVNFSKYLLERKDSLEKALGIGLILFALFCIYANTGQAIMINQNSGSGLPGQWETSMTWIRDNTDKDAVIAHWWDYGYWTQAIAKRATVLDGGNAMAWDHAMGRYGLTHNNLDETFDYFKTHKVTHLLISEEEIGKYHAFSTIGSDENYDRRSNIGVFVLDGQKEIRDGNEYQYRGGWGLDEDIIVDMKVLPQGTPLAGITITQTNDGTFSAPILYFFPDGQQFAMNADCLVFEGNKYEFNVDNAMHACVIVLPYYMDNENINPIGGIFFASSKVRDGNLARLYLYDETIPGFEKVYDDGTPLGLYQGRIIGSIKIWEINYPISAKADDKYLEKSIYG